MMKNMPRLLHVGRVLLLLFALVAAATPSAYSQAQIPAFINGDIILYCQPGTAQTEVEALAAKAGAEKITPLLLKDCYKLTLPENKKTPVATTDAIAALKEDARARWVGPNRLRQIDQTIPKDEPNDPRYTSGEMWGLKLIRMPEAWVLQKGALNTTVAVVDSAFNPAHEDLGGQYHADSFDFADNDANFTATANDAGTQHGTHTSGTIIAKTNNNIGIAGVVWENVKCLACKIQPDSLAGTPALSGQAIINALTYIAQNKQRLNIVAVNMSFSGPGDPNDVNDPEYVATKSGSDAGIIMVSSAGNSGADNSGRVPAAYTHVLAISALAPNSNLATYSSFGKVDLAAPGGDISLSGRLTDGILSTLANGYEFLQGTSMASPHVAGVATLMMSVPGMTAPAAIQAMKDTANRTGLTNIPDTKFGFGIVDAYAALLKVSVRINILDPEGTNAQGIPTDPNNVEPPIETLKPTLRFQLANVAPASVDIKIDGVTVLAGTDILPLVETGTAPTLYTIALRQKLNPGAHTVTITGANAGSAQTTSDTRTFTITPHMLRGGRSFVSIPYFEGPADGGPRSQDQLLGAGFRLFRWIPEDNKYVSYPSTDPKAAYATFAPPDSAPAPEGESPKQPLGLAYFLDLPADTPFLTNGRSFENKAFNIPLRKGWNMVGDPYNFAVPFNTAQVQLPDGSRISVQQAADRRILLPTIYRFVENEYQFRTLPDGFFAPWEGHWLYVYPNGPHDSITLILAPTPTSGGGAINRSARSGNATRTAPANAVLVNGDGSPRISGPGSWTVRLVARAKNMQDSQNFVGMTTRATDGDDLTKVPKPPMASPFVSLGIVRNDLHNGLYAQDLRPIGGTRTWEVAVATDQPNTDVVLTWPDVRSLPRAYRLTLTDKASGQAIDLRQHSSYRFNSGSTAGTRAFSLTARPAAAAGRPLLTNIFVNPGASGNGRGAATYEIGYTVSQDARVEVSILGANGRTLARVGATREVARGDNRVVWNGRDDAGRQIPGGVYSLQLRAYTPDGGVTRMIYPFVNPGR